MVHRKTRYHKPAFRHSYSSLVTQYSIFWLLRQYGGHLMLHQQNPPNPQSPLPFLLCWDFNGVIDTYGLDLDTLLQSVIDRGGHNIIISNGSTDSIRQYLIQRQLADYFDHLYGMDRHHGLVARHKIAAIHGHIQDAGPFRLVIIIGDSLSDIHDGHDAGVTTCLFDPHQRFQHTDHPADYVIQSLTEVLDLVPVD